MSLGVVGAWKPVVRGHLAWGRLGKVSSRWDVLKGKKRGRDSCIYI